MYSNNPCSIKKVYLDININFKNIKIARSTPNYPYSLGIHYFYYLNRISIYIHIYT